MLHRLVHETGFLAAITAWTPHLLEEVQGIAEGAGLDFETVLAFQLGDESGWYLDYLQGGEAAGRCTAFGCPPEAGRPALLAQNVDWTDFAEGLEVLLHLKDPDTGLEALAPSIAGVIGACGVNSRGVGICTNALWTYLNNSTAGLPVNFVVRGVLERDSLAAAADWVRHLPHASAENYVLGDPGGIVDLECSANQVTGWLPPTGHGRLWHTNHPLANDDLIFPPPPRRPSSSHARLDYLAHRLSDPGLDVDADACGRILSSHEGPVCVHHGHRAGGMYTFASAILLLGSPPAVHLTMGPPCDHEYRRYTF